MDPDGSITILIVISIILTIFNYFFICFKSAYNQITESQFKELLLNKNKKWSNNIKDNPSKFINKISSSSTLSIIISSITGFILLNNAINNIIINSNINLNLLINMIILLLTSIFVFILSYNIPIKLFIKNPIKLISSTVFIVNFTSILFTPLIQICSLLSYLISKVLKINTEKVKSKSIEDEIKMIINETDDNNTKIEETQKDMINNIFEFSDISSSDIMTHRTEIAALSMNSSIEDIVSISISKGFSRIPIYETDIDNIIGVIHVKDLLCLIGCTNTTHFNISHFLRPLVHITEYTKCQDIFQKLISEKIHMAIVVDQYGGTSGLVTMEDLVESILGNIQDEYDNEEELFTQITPSTFLIDGTTNLDKVSKYLGIDLPSNNYDTLSGYLIDQLMYIPNEDQLPTIFIDNIEFKVISVEDRRISKVRVIKNEKLKI